MIKLDATYSDYRDDSDPDYPGGKAVDASTTESLDGTPYKKNWMNDINGFRQALWVAAFGSIDGLSCVPDRVGASDSLKSMIKLIANIHDGMYKTATITGEETVVTWAALGLSEAMYQIIIQAAGNYSEFLPFGYLLSGDGVHIFPHRLVDGKILNSTRRKKWGSCKWGSIKWGAYASMPINIIIKEVTA